MVIAHVKSPGVNEQNNELKFIGTSMKPNKLNNVKLIKKSTNQKIEKM